MSGLREALTQRRAATDPRSTDPRLRGRTYTIPFEEVWQAARVVGDGGIRGWSVVRKDDRAGLLQMLVQPAIGPHAKHVDIRVRIGLDSFAQTRVDVIATSRTERGDLGRSKRLVGLFLDRLDDGLDARPHQILDPDTLEDWLARTAPDARSETTAGATEG